MFDTKKRKNRGRGPVRLIKPNLGRREDRIALMFDIGALILGLLFSCAHIAFGAYPLGIALIAVLPGRVWYAVLGAALGALTLGKSGLIYGMIYIILAFLRLIVSGGTETKHRPESEAVNGSAIDEAREEDGLSMLRGVGGFREGLMLRVSVSVIGGFISGVYEILLGGFTEETLAFAISKILLPPLVTVGLYGLFNPDCNWRGVLTDEEDRPEHRSRTLMFRGSALVLCFLLSLCLAPYSFLGISVSYLLAGVGALLGAYRYGAIAGGAVGFACALGLSGTYATAFALGGLLAGALFKLGAVFGMVGGGVAIALFSAYSGGLEGFLTVMPEYLISSAIAAPVIRKLPSAKSEAKEDSAKSDKPDLRLPRDMVGTVALSYRNKYKGSLGALEKSLGEFGRSLKRYGESSSSPNLNDYRDLIADCIRNFYTDCRVNRAEGVNENNSLPIEQAPMPTDGELDALASKLMTRGRVEKSDLSTMPTLCSDAEAIAEAVMRAVAILRRDCYGAKQTDTVAEDFTLISRLLSEGRLADEGERQVNEERTKTIERILTSRGITDGVCLAIGERQCHLILSAPDPEGSRLSGGELLRALEEGLDMRLSLPDYSHRDGVALLECHALPRLCCRAAVAGIAKDNQSVSGDTAISFKTEDGKFHCVLSDGMGSGEEARLSADFVAEFMRSALAIGTGAEVTLGILNRIIKRQRTERSVTLDLFTADLITGEGSFLKSGAASSYVKRGSSIFRIRSRTAPLGLLSGLDAEHIRSEIAPGSYVIMLSDGIAVSTEDSGWFLEMLACDPPSNLEEYASHILNTCLSHLPRNDDCTVAVIRIDNAD